jgi:hypothetical protein
MPAAELAVKLLQPMQGLLLSGETAKAEVIAIKESAQSFQLLLKLTLDNGRQTTLQAESARPLAQGSLLNVTALSDTRLSLLATGSTEKLLQTLDLNKLPVGTLLQGKVVSSVALPQAQAQAQQTLYKVIVSLLNTPLAGSKLVVETPIPLVPGSLLSAQVQSNQSLSFLPLSSRLDQLVLTQQLASSHNKQGSLEALLGALQGLRSQPPTAGSEGLRQSIDKLFGALPDVAQLSTGKGLAQALENSGLLLESKLLSAQAGTLPTDLKANLLRLISQLLPLAANGQPFAAASASSALAHALPAMARNLLGGLEQANSRMQALRFPLPSRLLQSMDGEADLETLLKLAAAALSRLQTHQLSSLAQSSLGPDGNLLTTWQLELPMRNQQEMIPLQLKIQRDEAQKKDKEEKKETLWKVELAFDLDPLGPLQVQAQLAHGQLSSQLWAERASTVSLIDAELDNLRERLNAIGVQVSELACNQGKPPQGPRTTLEQRWVDETA